MKKEDVEIGSIYLANVSGKRTRIRITNTSKYKGWECINLSTNRKIHIKTAKRLLLKVA